MGNKTWTYCLRTFADRHPCSMANCQTSRSRASWKLSNCLIHIMSGWWRHRRLHTTGPQHSSSNSSPHNPRVINRYHRTLIGAMTRNKQRLWPYLLLNKNTNDTLNSRISWVPNYHLTQGQSQIFNSEPSLITTLAPLITGTRVIQILWCLRQPLNEDESTLSNIW